MHPQHLYDMPFQQFALWFEHVNPYLLVLMGFVGFFVHFMPSLVAVSRKHNKQMMIFIWNVLLGWTGIVWIILLIWALDTNTEHSRKAFR